MEKILSDGALTDRTGYVKESLQNVGGHMAVGWCRIYQTIISRIQNFRTEWETENAYDWPTSEMTLSTR